jgi:type II secretory pathway pseudopilin PulG
MQNPHVAEPSPWWYVLTVVLSIISSVIVAVLSSWLSAKREREAMIRERAFKESVEWYFRISRTLVDFMFLYAEEASPFNSAERSLEIQRQKVEQSRRLTAETIEAHGYIPVETLHTLQTLQANLSKLGGQPAVDATQLRQEMQRAHFALAGELRKLLKLKELPKLKSGKF